MRTLYNRRFDAGCHESYNIGMSNRWYWCPIFMAVASATDLWCTLAAYRGGWLIERNPLAGAILAFRGPFGLAIFKVVLTAIGCALLVTGLRSGRLFPRIAAILLCSVYGMLVAWWTYALMVVP